MKRITVLFLLTFAWGTPAHASFLEGDALDSAANVISWIAILIVPVVLIGAFWWVHIMPEKIAEKREHPQLAAIKVLCLLSLVFGGLLWPLAWVWAYTRPVFHKMAYGTDTLDEQGHAGDALGLEPTPAEAPHATPAPSPEDTSDLRLRIASLEKQLAALGAQTLSPRSIEEGGA
ncbi:MULTISPECIES: DUF3302 domain-containing protein [unclassified Brevundimonas]|uniref:DUF3302 domain-containing protein n=1 Tax=unclassified Brevundimonas TaxID=2622653 RepID=UPI000CFB040D|nr:MULTISPECIES: DUF3302 domain-containing protein [unclassified Brevundimonas]PRA22388.1 hypothetical protein CQ024_15770 [Brevundimonas sp. MYb27]PQZ73731.1 hypothetical protein CQ026_16085 [Brevundimonas sp. MYb31]PRB10288.1 hypothetical protein CQ039_16225 [Brevundimonas sp. MYb52]PRB32280.1 hypothetical protein CQ035_16185 [Brevundimonas sp. MYb46]PRB40958.1 hypothetical protein CQ028_15830 [Brevundimonas sp. MYb33]